VIFRPVRPGHWTQATDVQLELYCRRRGEHVEVVAVGPWSAGHDVRGRGNGILQYSSADARSNRSAQFPARVLPDLDSQRAGHARPRPWRPNKPQLPRPHMDFPPSWHRRPCHLVDATDTITAWRRGRRVRTELSSAGVSGRVRRTGKMVSRS
jgi:hypothetical protein